ncbi:hypothetical protein CYY_003225 [Polysphondylium violaceum]|uniref:Peptidase M8 n=1 Tax=Polysphondylium violaceum TaxID=133409 RepID=A0A8J4Q028_9MYCE|nr:hypothetical protein CYY_003225 [Polysphondylium violaceum]
MKIKSLVLVFFISTILFYNVGYGFKVKQHTSLHNLNTAEDARIQQIIDKGYNRLVEDLKNKNIYHGNEKVIKTPSQAGPDGHLSYHCQHDVILDRKIDNIQKAFDKVKDKMSKGQKSDFARKRDQQTHHILQDPSPIRINFNTELITGTNDEFACYTEGALVSVGAAGGKTMCNDDSSGACLHKCTKKDIQTAGLQNLISQHVLTTIQDVLNDKIFVRDPKVKTVFDQDVADEFGGECDYGIKIPESFYSDGVEDTDIYVWVTLRPTSNNNTIAYAFSCNFPITQDGNLGRPIGATINFNPIYFVDFIGSESGFYFNEYIRVGIHEMTHALGFSRTFYGSFVNYQTGDGYDGGTFRDFNYVSTTPSGDRFNYTRTGIVTPNVLSFARDHYDCSTQQMQELEDYGGSGTAGSHWEKRTAGEEYMVGFVSPVEPITNLTLSLLLDTGWYSIDPTSADPFVWGQGLGCSFLDSCTPDSWNYQGYFCTVDGATSCTGTRVGKGVCRLGRARGSVPKQYQHFTDPQLVGLDGAADYCPFYDVFDDDANTYYCTNAALQSEKANKDIGETFCENCRCFEYQNSETGIEQACWEQRCQGTSLQLYILGSWVDCPDSTTVVHQGVTVVCPKGYTQCGGKAASVPVGGENSSSILSSLAIHYTLLIVAIVTFIAYYH